MEQTPQDKLAYTGKEISNLARFSRDTVTKLFKHEPGVLIIERPGESHKRRYRSIRIPCAVYARVIRPITV